MCFLPESVYQLPACIALLTGISKQYYNKNQYALINKIVYLG